MRCRPTLGLTLGRPQRAMPQPSRRRGAAGLRAGRQRPPPPSRPAPRRASGAAGPGCHLPRVQTGEQAEEEEQLRGHGAAQLGKQGLGPPAGRGFPRSAGLASADSPLPRCLCRHGLRRYTGSWPPRPDRCGLRRAAAPPTARGSARSSAGRTRDALPPRRAAPARRPGAGSAPPGGGSWWAPAVPSPAAPRRAAPSAASCARVHRRVCSALCVRPPHVRRWGQQAAAPPAAPARRPRRGGVSPITRLTSRSAKKARSEWTQSLRPGKGAGLSGGGEAWGSRREPLEESQGLASQG